MILDKLLRLQDLTAITVTAPTTDVIDVQVARDFGVGDAYERMSFVVTVGTALAAAGAATLQIQVQGSTDNAAWTTMVQTDAIPKANLGAGAQVIIPMPPQASAPHIAGRPRYYRLNFVVATGPFTAGTLLADLVPVAQQNAGAYPPGFSVAN